MNYHYDVTAMRDSLKQIVAENVSAEEFSSLQQRQEQFENERNKVFFNLTFTAVPRLVAKNNLQHAERYIQILQNIRKDFSIQGWTIDRLTRSWWLLLLDAEDEARYTEQVENFFKSAEMNEQVALYGSLPLLAYPDAFRQRAAQGLRTNISSVFEAIALDNPYPAEYFEEAAWNQMVLKAFFMNVNVNRIVGLESRANIKLAYILSDYAHERWSAAREVSALLWRPIGQFIDKKIFPDIQRLLQSEDDGQKKAAVLACNQSTYEPAKEILKQHPNWMKEIESGKLTWELLRQE